MPKLVSEETKKKAFDMRSKGSTYDEIKKATGMSVHSIMKYTDGALDDKDIPKEWVSFDVACKMMETTHENLHNIKKWKRKIHDGMFAKFKKRNRERPYVHIDYINAYLRRKRLPDLYTPMLEHFGSISEICKEVQKETGRNIDCVKSFVYTQFHMEPLTVKPSVYCDAIYAVYDRVKSQQV
jgi:hypothetical protein